MHISGG